MFVAWRQPRDPLDLREDGELMVIHRAIFWGCRKTLFKVFYYTQRDTQNDIADDKVDGDGWLFDDHGHLIGLRGSASIAQPQRDAFLL
jgi:hypothetical protein